MANRRSINSPGVEIREIDLSTRATTPIGTSVLVAGFASQGPTSEILNVSTISDFENIYGTPTNAAERYFYYSVRQLFAAGTNAVVNVARLPYGSGSGEGYTSQYSALIYPVAPLSSTSEAVSTVGTRDLSAATTYYLGRPTLIPLAEEEYNLVKQGTINWASSINVSAGASVFTSVSGATTAGLIVLNEAKTTINEKFEGYYFNIADNTHFNPTNPYHQAIAVDTIASASTTGTSAFTTIPSTRLGFAVSATSASNIDSISQTIENIPDFDISTANTGYGDTAVLSLFKIRTTPFEKNSLTLSYVLQEGYTTSMYVNRTVQNSNGGAPENRFAGTYVNDLSPNLTVLVNPNISNAAWLNDSGNAQKFLRVVKYSDSASLRTAYGTADELFPLGVYAPSLNTGDKLIGSVGTKLDTILNLAENADIVNIDVIADAGLSTIAAIGQTITTTTYDDTVYTSAIVQGLSGLTDTTGSYTASTLVGYWKDVTDKFVEFTTNRRKDCIFISDPIRHVLVQGENFKTLDDKSKNFSANIYWPLRNLYSFYNTSYATTYGNWGKTTDKYSNKPVWVPFSAYAAAIYTTNDAVAYPWGAPAGLNRGVVTGIADLAINPQQKQRDLLYKISINPVVNFPQEGFTIMGQKTLLKAPSAFDRINVRRLFLYLEKSVLNTSKFFVFEPNTSFTRNRLVNTITPVFDLAKNTQGVYDYLIVCNDTNNTADVVDDNTLVVDIYIKPTRTAEFILVNFYATRTNQNFQELLQ